MHPHLVLILAEEGETAAFASGMKHVDAWGLSLPGQADVTCVQHLCDCLQWHSTRVTRHPYPSSLDNNTPVLAQQASGIWPRHPVHPHSCQSVTWVAGPDTRSIFTLVNLLSPSARQAEGLKDLWGWYSMRWWLIENADGCFSVPSTPFTLSLGCFPGEGHNIFWANESEYITDYQDFSFCLYPVVSVIYFSQNHSSSRRLCFKPDLVGRLVIHPSTVPGEVALMVGADTAVFLCP